MLKITVLLSIATCVVGQIDTAYTSSEFYTFNKNTHRQPPHIIFITADDLGWNDVSFHGSPQIPTPNIDALAASGIVLNNYYVENLCTPSRAAFMTGRYPIHTGLMHNVIRSGEATALPIKFKILPQFLKNKGYTTHMVGKWHLGFYENKYTPVKRGFDSFFGFFNGKIDYYDYTNYEKYEDFVGMPFFGVDLYDGINLIKNFRGKYATETFTEKAVKVIENHNSSKPLFLFLSHFAPHLGNEYYPLQAPDSYVQKMNHIKEPKRRIFGGMISALDTSIGKVIQTLSQRGFLKNSIIVFSSDNGGETEVTGFDSRGSVWPLRGQKFTYFEGGIRVPSFLWSPLLGLKEPRIANQLMHISDWLPTLYSAAGGHVSDLGDIDGISMWQALKYNTASPRTEVLHNIDQIASMYGLRKGDYKLIASKILELEQQWVGPTGFEDMPAPPSMDDWVFQNGSIVRDILQASNLWLLKTKDEWRNGLKVHCRGVLEGEEVVDMCNKGDKACLFNIAEDPCERRNIAHLYPEIVKSMMEIVERYNATTVEPLTQDRDPKADPRCHDFAFVPWREKGATSSCKFM
ncbi:hypothetical protein JTE90_010985 [Oedothorax gibbosus]|uniref:Sulfatase N-terminal domain-containing protein n=1 Tax=Oedothorax gibbosus TaxID=931172 RepID=A0AAV6VCI3_9ARAC|nr:hypothetical protein JTE90_010985 [Oedothorax gibbosus]